MKFDSVDYKQYTDWQRYILRTHPVIPKDCRRVVLIGFCFVLATHGSAGLDCYASDSLLGQELGISRRHLKKYRQLAKELGWFVPRRKVNRVESLDVAIPRVQRDVPELSVEAKAAVTEDQPKAPVQPVSGYRPEDDPWAGEADQLLRGTHNPR